MGGLVVDDGTPVARPSRPPRQRSRADSTDARPSPLVVPRRAPSRTGPRLRFAAWPPVYRWAAAATSARGRAAIAAVGLFVALAIAIGRPPAQRAEPKFADGEHRPTSAASAVQPRSSSPGPRRSGLPAPPKASPSRQYNSDAPSPPSSVPSSIPAPRVPRTFTLERDGVFSGAGFPPRESIEILVDGRSCGFVSADDEGLFFTDLGPCLVQVCRRVVKISVKEMAGEQISMQALDVKEILDSISDLFCLLSVD